MSDKLSDQDWERMKLLERDVALSMERLTLAYTEMAMKYEIHPERGDKYDVRSNEIIRK